MNLKIIFLAVSAALWSAAFHAQGCRAPGRGQECREPAPGQECCEPALSYCDEAEAEDSRPVLSVYSLEIGSHWARSTYLSPSRYSGTEVALSGHWGKRMPFAPERARMDFDARGALWWRMDNPARNVSMQGFELEFSWQMSAFWQLPAGFQVSVGGGPELEGGTLILLRNSNNPVNVNLSAALAAGASISNDFRIGRLPVTAFWRLRSPMIGAFFMPGYGETYYEIYLGNREGLVHCGWSGNHFRLDSHVGLQMDFGRTAMEVGYRFITDSMHANNLTTSQFTHAFTIGVIPHGLGRKKSNR